MSIVSQTHPYVVGVDTHARKHVYTILATTGALVDTAEFPNTPAGIARTIAWVARRTDADADVLWVIEGAASYGAALAAALISDGYPVAEAPRMETKHRYGIGKSDSLDSHRIATTTLSLPVDKLRRPRLNDGVRQAVRILLTARSAMAHDHNRTINALTGLVRSNNLGIDARATLKRAQIVQIAAWRRRNEELSRSVARAEAIRLAKRAIDLEAQLANNQRQLAELIQLSEAAPLVDEPGIGVITAAKCLTVWSHHGRIRTEAEFASIAGVNPIPASSGNTTRHRLNRGGDRSLNSALHMVAISKMTTDPETRDYVAKRPADGKTDREIRRCLKRYIARRIFKLLNTQALQHQPV